MHAGFTLVELMVGIAIGVFLLLGLAILFANISAGRNEVDKASRQIESGRYALSILADDIRHAGYYGPLVSAPTFGGGSLPDACANALADVQGGLGLPLQGYERAATASALDATLDTAGTCVKSAAAGYKPNTAVLVVRRANTAGAACAAPDYCIQVSGCAGDAAAYVLDAAGAGTFGLHANTAPGCLPLATAPQASITPLYVRIYFVSTCSGADCSAAGSDSVPTLKRIDVTTAGTTITPIVDGIENIQFEYGVDTTAAPGDGSSDVYVNTPLTLGQWQNVMSVRIHLLARNVDRSVDYADSKVYALGPVTFTPSSSGTPPETSFRRHAYTQLVRLNNPSGRRE
jgi:type IV pilus assembly protein PilW